jgi:hypothetical protein
MVSCLVLDLIHPFIIWICTNIPLFLCAHSLTGKKKRKLAMVTHVANIVDGSELEMAVIINLHY